MKAKSSSQLLSKKVDEYLLNMDDGMPLEDATAILFEGVATFQNGIAAAVQIETSNLTHGAIDILDELAGGADLAGAYPFEFQLGRGGALDEFLEGLQKCQAKAYAKLRKSLLKAAKNVRKKHGVALNT